MEKLRVNFFGEKTLIEVPADIALLRAEISKQYLLSPQDAAEILIYYLKDSNKIYLSSLADYGTFLKEKIQEIFLDVSQDSKIYLNYKSKIQNEAKDDKTILEELLSKKKEYEKQKKEREDKYTKDRTELYVEIRKLDDMKRKLLKDKETDVKEIEEKIKANDQEIEKIKKKIEPPKEEKEKLNAVKIKPQATVHQWCRSGQNNFPYRIMKMRAEKKRLAELEKERVKKERVKALNISADGGKNISVPVFSKVNEVLTNTVEKVKEVVLKAVSNTGDKDKENEEEIKQIKEITKDAVKEINNITKLVIQQSNELINKFETEKKLSHSISLDKLKASKKPELLTPEEKEKAKNITHFMINCTGCHRHDIVGVRYKCKVCRNVDYCEKCYEKNKKNKTHEGHEFIPILESEFNERAKSTNNKKQRYIIQRDERCNVCGMLPIMGIRYKCAVCDDFNFCENCEESCADKHRHPLIKLTYSYMEDEFNKHYLKLNSYDGKNEK